VFHSPYSYEAIDPFFRYKHPSAFWAFKFQRRRWGNDKPWDGYVRFFKRSRVPSGLFLAQRERLVEQFDLSVDDQRQSVSFNPLTNSSWAFQNECLAKMLKARNHGGLILNATGSGKTRIAGLYFKALRGSGCFVVDELTLLDQARKALSEVIGESVGIIGAGRFSPRRITVATVQTLHRHRHDKEFKLWMRGLQVLFIDEVHLALNKRNLSTVQSINPPVVLGLTATLSLQKAPIRLRAFALTGPVLYEYPYRRGVEEKHLTSGIVIAVDLDRSVGNTESGTHSEAYDRFVVRSKRRNNLIEAIIREAHELGYHTIALVERIRHLKFLSRRVSDVPHRVVYGAKSRSFRRQAKKSFDASRIRLLIANRVFKKGVDIKKVDTMIDGASYRSREDAMQKFGRGVRLCVGKRGLIYYDVGDSGLSPFTKATKYRRGAFRKAGIPVFKYRWTGDVKDLFEFAQKKLESTLKKEAAA